VRVALDTNCVISGFFWRGHERALLDLARTRQIDAFTSMTLLTELDRVLKRPKFASRLAATGVDAITLVTGYASLATVINNPHKIPPVCRDPSDDDVLACALAASADVITSGDKDLLVLKCYGQIRIASSAQTLALFHMRPVP
jgi:putative PIN family toxin of toxin-antitoxin system